MPVVERPSVSGHAALLRAATGLGVSVVLISFVAFVWHDVVELSLGLMFLGSVHWLHEPNDRHSKAAIVVAGGLSLVIAVGAVALLRDTQAEFSRMVGCAGLAALVGSQVYAAISRRRS
jgi:thiol:disulfide interchange protein